MTLDIHINWQLSKQENRWPVSHDHIGGSDVVSESWKMAPKENMQGNLQLQFDLEDLFHG